MATDDLLEGDAGEALLGFNDRGGPGQAHDESHAACSKVMAATGTVAAFRLGGGKLGVMTLSRVLVGDDRSPGAAAARAWANALAGAAGAEVVVAGVTDTAAGAGTVEQQLTGPPAPALLGFADEISADLVVVGRRGAGGFDALRLGSTAHQLAEHTTRPLAVVPPTPPHVADGWPFVAIVVGHDGSPVAAGALAWTVPLATQSAAAVVVTHALELAPAFAAGGLGGAYEQARAGWRSAVDEWCAPLSKAGVRCSTVVEEGGPTGVLLDAVRTRNADLLVVGRRASGTFPGISMGSAAHRALGFAPCPTVVVPAAG